MSFYQPDEYHGVTSLPWGGFSQRSLNGWKWDFPLEKSHSGKRRVGGRDAQREENLGDGACRHNWESGNALIPVPVVGWDGDVVSQSPPGILVVLGWTTPSSSSWGQLQPYLQIPVDKWNSLLLGKPGSWHWSSLSPGQGVLCRSCSSAPFPSSAGM